MPLLSSVYIWLEKETNVQLHQLKGQHSAVPLQTCFSHQRLPSGKGYTCFWLPTLYLPPIWLHGCQAEIVRHPLFSFHIQCSCVVCVPFCLGHVHATHLAFRGEFVSSHHPSVLRAVNLANRSCATLSDLCSVQCFRQCTFILKTPIFKALSVSRYGRLRGNSTW